METSEEVVVLGSHGEQIVALTFRNHSEHWLPLHDPFLLPELIGGQTRQAQILSHPALHEKLRRGTPVREFVVGEQTPAITDEGVRVPASLALLNNARSLGLPAFPADPQAIVAVDLSSDGVTAAVLEAEANGGAKVTMEHTWTLTDLPPGWNVAETILGQIAPSQTGPQPELAHEVQRQVDAYLLERVSFPETPPLELVLPRLTSSGNISFTISDEVFETVMVNVMEVLTQELRNYYVAERPTFLIITGDRAHWPGVEKLTLPGHVIRFPASEQTMDALALGAALTWSPPSPELAHAITVRATHGGNVAELITIGSTESEGPVPQPLPVTFSQPYKDAPLEGKVSLELIRANGETVARDIELFFPPQGTGWKVFRRGDATLEEKETILEIRAESVAGEGMVTLDITVKGERDSKLAGAWYYREANRVFWYDKRVLEVKG